MAALLAAVGLGAVFARGGVEEPGSPPVRGADIRDPQDEAESAQEELAALAPVGAWRQLADPPADARYGHVAAWTGRCPSGSDPPLCGELLVWGGRDPDGNPLGAAAYSPEHDAWRRTTPPPVPVSRGLSVPAVWAANEPALPVTSSVSGEVLLWGIVDGARVGVGMAYDPQADRWRELPEAPIQPRVGHATVWTGRELVVWGGIGLATHGGRVTFGDALADGAAYNPQTDAWRTVAPSPLSARRSPAAVSRYGQVVVWGGNRGASELQDGAVYRPEEDDWKLLPALPARAAVSPEAHSTPQLAEVDGTLVLDATLTDMDGHPVVGLLDGAAGQWELLPRPAAFRRGPLLTSGPASTVVLWGGTPAPDNHSAAPDGMILHLSTGGWRAIPQGPRPMAGQTAAWTGQELLVWAAASRDPSNPGSNRTGAYDPNWPALTR